jgi:hypothetical protein
LDYNCHIPVGETRGFADIGLGGGPDSVPRPFTSKTFLRCHMPFIVEAFIDDCKLTATAKTAKKAFAEAIDWHVAKQLSSVTINDGVRCYSIAEFSETMALVEISNTL